MPLLMRFTKTFLLALLAMAGSTSVAASLTHVCTLPASSRAATFISAAKANTVSYELPADSGRIQMAVDAAQAFLDKFLIGHDGPFAEAYPPLHGKAKPAQYWNMAVGVSALAEQVRALQANGRGGSDQEKRLMGLIGSVISAQKSSSAGFKRDFFDDELWMVAALLDAYELTHNATHLSDARNLFNDVLQTGYDTSSGLVWWDRPHTQRATAANGGAIVIALRLGALQNDMRKHGIPALDVGAVLGAPRAQQPYGHLGNELQSFAAGLFSRWMVFTQASGEVVDHLDPQGNRIYYGSGFTYNQALLLRAAQALATLAAQAGNASDAAGFQRQADLLMSYSATAQTTAGGVLVDCANDAACTSGDCVEFKGILFTALGDYLDAQCVRALSLAKSGSATESAIAAVLDPVCTAQHVLWTSINSAHSKARSPDNLFSCQWQNAWVQGATVLQGAQNTALAAFAREARQKGLFIKATAAQQQQPRVALE